MTTVTIYCKLRVPSRCLLIQTGRYKNVTLERRACPLCTLAVEDEVHVFLKVSILQSFKNTIFEKSALLYKIL
jgi:hypothetical protein